MSADYRIKILDHPFLHFIFKVSFTEHVRDYRGLKARAQSQSLLKRGIICIAMEQPSKQESQQLLAKIKTKGGAANKV